MNSGGQQSVVIEGVTSGSAHQEMDQWSAGYPGLCIGTLVVRFVHQ